MTLEFCYAGTRDWKSLAFLESLLSKVRSVLQVVAGKQRHHFSMKEKHSKVCMVVWKTKHFALPYGVFLKQLNKSSSNMLRSLEYVKHQV